jgi:hypothetical protein
MFLVPTFMRVSTFNHYIFLIIFLVPHVFVVCFFSPYRQILFAVEPNTYDMLHRAENI